MKYIKLLPPSPGPSKGFTLIELLIVIGIVVILLAAALVAINPFRQFAQANNVVRLSGVTAIRDAISQNVIDNRGLFVCPAGDIPATPTIMGSGPGQYNICDCLVPLYLAAMPVDPQYGYYNDCNDYNTEYTIQSASIIISAPHAQLGEEISAILPGEITIRVPSWDFSLSVNPNSSSVAPGGSVSATVDATLISGTSQSVSFSASGFPPNATVSFSPPNCNPTCSATMTISTSATTPPGTYAINITGTGGGLTRTTNYSLLVTGTAPFSWFQTDWSGGADTVNFPIHPTDQTGWDKYYSKEAEIDDSIPGQLILTP